MEQKIKTLLSEYGLDEKEIAIYLLLVQKGELNAYVLAKLAKIHRSTVYSVLERLLAKGFIAKIEKDKKTFYSAVEIGKTISRIKDKENLLQSLIPEIEKLHDSKLTTVRVMESQESQKQFGYNLFNQITNGSIKELYIISGGPTDYSKKNKKVGHLSTNLFLANIQNELKKSKQKVMCKSIWDERFKGSEFVKHMGFGENRFLAGLPTKATTVIFGGYLAYMYTLDGTPQVIEIQNQLIADENKAYFEYLWKQANK